MEAARRSNFAPVIIRTSYATSVNYAGRAVAYQDDDDDESCIKDRNRAAVSGAIALALHVRTMARHYGVSVILQTETLCLRQLGNWYEGVLKATKAYFLAHEEPLFSSHRLDLTVEYHGNTEEILAIAIKYLESFQKVNVWLELILSDVISDELCHPCEKIPEIISEQQQQSIPATAFLSRQDCVVEGVPAWICDAHDTLSQTSKNGFSILVHGDRANSSLSHQSLPRNINISRKQESNRALCPSALQHSRSV